MKKTINVSVGSYAFTLDQDAYDLLTNYLKEVRSRFFDNEAREIMEDIENRIAEIFQSELRSPHQVVDQKIVKRAITIIGAPESFGFPKDGQFRQEDDHQKQRHEYSKEEKRLLRTRGDQAVIGGVCGGIAKYFNLDPVILRIAILLLLLIGGVGLIAYLIMWIAIPKEASYYRG